jgi:hypothetical protein
MRESEVPYEVKVDPEKRRVVTTWGRAVTGAALLAYQSTVWSDRGLADHDELIDFRGLESVQVTQEQLRDVARLAAGGDEPSSPGTRFAIVVGDQLTFGLSRMYEALRSLQPGGTREVRVFRSRGEAEAWLDERIP